MRTEVAPGCGYGSSSKKEDDPAGSIKRLRLTRAGSAILESSRAQCLAVASCVGLSPGGGISDGAGAKLQQTNWRSPASNS